MSTTKNKGGRPPNPTPKWNPEKERWEVRMSIPDQGRRLRVIPELGPRDEERAKRIVKLMVKRAAVDGYVPDEIGLTVNDWCDTWLEDRELRKIKTVGHDKGRLAHHVLPTIGTLAMSQVTREDIERVVEALDAKIRLDDDDDEHIEWKTASNVWTVVTTMFKDAMSAKNRELRVRKDNPCTGVRGPERGEPKAKQFLFPSEFLKLISCRRIGRRYRQLYAVAVYVLARGGEIEALTWDDVNLEHRVISITKAVDKGTRIVTSTKSKVSRRVPIEPNLLPLLQALYEERDTSEDADRTVMWMPNHDERAIKLREHLKRAKVERANLHLNDARHKHLTFHDLRATGITWAAVRGDDPLKIKQRAGHATFTTTEGYIREAENLRDGFGQPFPPLPPELLESCGLGSGVLATGTDGFSEESVEQRGIEPRTSALRTQRSPS